MGEHCAGATPMPTQKIVSKPLFQPGWAVNTLRTGCCTDVMDITSLLIKIDFGNHNTHQ